MSEQPCASPCRVASLRPTIRCPSSLSRSRRLTASSPTSIRSRRPIRQMVLGLCLIAPAAAAEDGDRNFQATLEKGRAIAEANCSPCHAVGPTDESPTRVNANTAFRMLYERYPIPMLEEAAKTGSVSGHDEMPGFDFALEDARALLAYIDSLTPDKPGYVSRPGKP